MIQLITTVIITPAVDAVATNTDNSLEILSKVNEFYDSAWSKLIYLLTGAFAVLGVIMPFAIQHYQTKALRASENEIETKIKKTLEQEFNKKFEEKIAEFKSETERNHNLFSALFLQFNADNLLEKGSYYKSIIDYVGAIGFYVACKDLAGISMVLDNLHRSVSNLSEAELTKLKADEDISLMKNLKDIDDIENSLVLRDKITLITETIN
jgi:hypothetical protein